MAGQARAEAVGVDLERLGRLLFVHVTDAEDFVYCGKSGGARGSCVRITWRCANDDCTKHEIHEVKTFGPAAGETLAELVERLEELEQLWQAWIDVAKAFMEGRAKLSDVAGARWAYESAKRKLEDDILSSIEAFAQAMAMNPASFDFYSHRKDTSDACQRLIEAINDVVDHPEGEW